MSGFPNKKQKLFTSLVMLQASVQAWLEPIHAVSVVSNLAGVAVPSGHFVVGTHDGSFHCDEALAISMLQLHPTYQNRIQIVRTRNPDILAVSITGVYNTVITRR